MSATRDDMDGTVLSADDFLDWCKSLEDNEINTEKKYPPLPDDARQMMEGIILELGQKGS